MAFVLAESEAAARAHLERVEVEQKALAVKIAVSSRDEKHLYVDEAKDIAERLKVARQALEGLKEKP